MCGIAGLIKKDSLVAEQELKLMADALQHRGPDGEGYFVHQQVGLAHRRLSIIDLEGGKQPFATEDGKMWISFNGEIYNYIALRSDLQSKGHQFRTQSDTEVLLYAYRQWGADCVHHLRGMFAFAVLDLVKQELFLARDHFGIKPLVYLQTEQVFAFASEIQALKQIPNVALNVDITAIDLFLQYQYIPAPRSIYHEIKKLPPAHFMRVDLQGKLIELKRYWQLSFQPNESKSASQWLEELEAVIKDSVQAHLVSDVPFGAFLSGGVDSSAVVAYMAQLMKQPVKTFSIGFEESAFNETTFAQQVANRWHTEHHIEIVNADALGILPDLVRHYGEPFGDNSAIPTYYVSKLARKHVTMVLTGDAGDEIFAGYESYTSRWSRHVQPVPEHLAFPKKQFYPIANALLPSKFPLRTAKFSDWEKYGQKKGDANRRSLWRKEIAEQIQREEKEIHELEFERAADFGHFQQVQSVDFNVYMPNAILPKVDIASMMHSLETRTPLLDKQVIEFAATIPEHLNISKVNGQWIGKQLLKKLMCRYYPKDFVYREKMGFASPVSHWLLENGHPSKAVADRLYASGNHLDTYLDLSAVKKLSGSKSAHQLWNLLFLEEWLGQNN
ncbi:asparagine synthase (glutamine-hydrolyzing) [Fulvivirgaceae bacterium LMO-SS25]